MKIVLSLLAAGSLSAFGAAASLDAYVGKHPHEKVGPTTFLTNPTVNAAILKAVPDADIRNFIADRDMTTAPIRRSTIACSSPVGITGAAATSIGPC